MKHDLDRTLAAMADPARRAIIERLLRGPARSSDLADALRLSRSAMSKHLRVLRTAGVVAQEVQDSDARVRMVQLRPEPFADVRRWLDVVEEFWHDQLHAFKAHAERKHGKRRPQ